jgi:glutamine synthetase
MMEKDGRAGFAISLAVHSIIGDEVAAGVGPVGETFHTIDLNSVRRLSYANGHAFVTGFLQEKEKIRGSYASIDFCPRTILARIIEWVLSLYVSEYAHCLDFCRDAKAKDGVKFLVGFEVEFVLLYAKDLKPINDEGYCIASGIPEGSDVAMVLDEITDALEVARIELQQYHSEAAKGQVRLLYF